jgi:hypothetical protein
MIVEIVRDLISLLLIFNCLGLHFAFHRTLECIYLGARLDHLFGTRAIHSLTRRSGGFFFLSFFAAACMIDVQ